MQNFDVIIIGGGAAGLACAVSLKRQDSSLSVAVCEKEARAGRKLSATGNGQGNITNAEMTENHFHGSLAPLAFKIIDKGGYDIKSLFDCLFVTDKSGRVYPAGKQASSLSDCLIRECTRRGVKLLLSSCVTGIEKGFCLTLSDGARLHAENVVMAFGGAAAKQYGTDGKSFSLAYSMGHTATQLQPAIVQLRCGTQYIKTLKGIRAECDVKAFDKNSSLLCETVGDIIFTDYGISGNAAFYCSSYVAGKEGAYLSLAFLPTVSEEEIARNVRLKEELGYPAGELLCGTLHNQIGRAIMRRCNSTKPEDIAHAVKNFTLNVEGSLGFDYAQVTKGGIPAKEVDCRLQSKIVKGLYFIGEALDVDGDCGGYNLTWAFASAMHAAKSICGGDCYD